MCVCVCVCVVCVCIKGIALCLNFVGFTAVPGSKQQGGSFTGVGKHTRLLLGKTEVCWKNSDIELPKHGR